MTDWLVKHFVKDYERTSDSGVRLRYGTMAGIVCIICNIVLCAAKAFVGVIAGSVAIVADAINNLSDAASNIVSLIGFKLASRPADPGHPYGHGRYEYVAGLVVSVLICAVGIELIMQGINRIYNPEPVELSAALIIVLVLAILVKLWMMLFNKRLSKTIDSSTLDATSIDSRNDVITTAAVLACTIITALCGINLDGWASVALGAYILYSGVKLVVDTLNPLLGQAESPEFTEHIKEKILSYPGILGTHGLMVHDYGPGNKFASAHVEMSAELDPIKSHEIIDEIEQDFLKNDGLVMTIHFDPVVEDEARGEDNDFTVDEFNLRRQK